MNNDLKKLINLIMEEWEDNAELVVKELLRQIDRKVPLQKAYRIAINKHRAFLTLPKLKTTLADYWDGSEYKRLSKRLKNSPKLTQNIIIGTIRQQMKLNTTWVGLARSLYDGYGYGKVIEPTFIPKYLQAVANATNNDKLLLRKHNIALKRIEKLSLNGAPNQALKVAYRNLLNSALTDSKAKLHKSIQVAVEEKSRYVAERIARTELARAINQKYVDETINDNDCYGYKVVLGDRHTEEDVCDEYANQDNGYGKGIYLKEDVPIPPYHPHCMCRLIAQYNHK